jgi:sugar lactone lactonase YvrE
VLCLPAPDVRPVPIARGIPSPGGLALDPDGGLIVGYGDDLRGVVGRWKGFAGLLRIDPNTGRRTTLATGLGMANGIARGTDGTIFASNDFGPYIERVDGHGHIDSRWAHVPSANGLALDQDERYLYATQTFVRPAVKRIDVATRQVTTHAAPGPRAALVALDGLAIDPDSETLYVAANAAGQVWRVDSDGTICVLADGLKFPSAVALGRGPVGFSHGNLYAVGFGGDVTAMNDLVS